MALLLTLLAYLLTLASGLPLGWRVFGRTPLGWITGACLGYGLSALAFWTAATAGSATLPGFLVAWSLVTLAAWVLSRGTRPWIPLQPWTPRDTRHWLAVMAVVAVFVVLPFSRVGEQDEAGTRHYRAYFTADFVWHMAMTEELRRFDLPPVDPYLAPEPIHYYWTYFLVPAVLAGPSTTSLASVETVLKVCAIGTAGLMFSALFLCVCAVVGHSRAAAAACLLALMATSWEGAFVLWQAWQRDVPWPDLFAQLRETNIDAITNWQFRGLRIDGLVRSMWWTPQHAMAFTFGLLAIVGAGLVAAVRPAVTIALGLLLALSVAFNPLLGASCCLIYGMAITWRVLRRALPPAALLYQACAIGPVALALVWTLANEMGSSAGGALLFGWQGLGRRAPFTTLILSLGGLLVPAALALVLRRRDTPGAWWIAIPGCAVAWALAWLVSLSTDAAWVGFRAGNLFQIMLPMLAAAGLLMLRRLSRTAAYVLVGLLLVIGAPTTLIDTFNAQDVDNRAMGPGFRWTVPISADQQAGFAWLRSMTAPRALVQADPIQRGRDQWSLLPSFAGRRTAAGEPISLIAVPEYRARSERVHHLLRDPDLERAHDEVRALHVGYLWLDEDDPADIAPRLATRPDLFGLRFQRGAVHIFEVR